MLKSLEVAGRSTVQGPSEAEVVAVYAIGPDSAVPVVGSATWRAPVAEGDHVAENVRDAAPPVLNSRKSVGSTEDNVPVTEMIIPGWNAIPRL